MRRIAVIAGALLVLGIGAAVVSAAIPDSDGYTYVCINNGDGTMRAREKAAACPRNWTASRLVANQTAVPHITSYVVKATDTETSGFGSAEALCNAGDIATGGGALLSDSIDDAQYLGDTQTEKLDGRQGWLGSWLNRSGGNATQTMTVKAICQHTE